MLNVFGALDGGGFVMFLMVVVVATVESRNANEINAFWCDVSLRRMQLCMMT